MTYSTLLLFFLQVAQTVKDPESACHILQLKAFQLFNLLWYTAETASWFIRLVTLMEFTSRSLQLDPYSHPSFISFSTSIFVLYVLYLSCSQLCKIMNLAEKFGKTLSWMVTNYIRNWAIIKQCYMLLAGVQVGFSFASVSLILTLWTGFIKMDSTDWFYKAQFISHCLWT